MAEERNLFAEVEEVEQLVRSQITALAEFRAEVISRLDTIVTLLEPPKPATTVVLTIGKPIPQ